MTCPSLVDPKNTLPMFFSEVLNHIFSKSVVQVDDSSKIRGFKQYPYWKIKSYNKVTKFDTNDLM